MRAKRRVTEVEVTANECSVSHRVYITPNLLLPLSSAHLTILPSLLTILPSFFRLVLLRGSDL